MFKKIVLGIVLACLISTPVLASPFEERNVEEKCMITADVSSKCYTAGFQMTSKEEFFDIISEVIKNKVVLKSCSTLFDIGVEEYQDNMSFNTSNQNSQMYMVIVNNRCMKDNWFDK